MGGAKARGRRAPLTARLYPARGRSVPSGRPTAQSLLGRTCMNARAIALALGIAATAVTARADAEAGRPVFVTVVGHGAIRFRLAIGRTAPCDSSDNRMLFDGWLTPGSYEWGTDAILVCYQHTSGALRESDWSTSQIVATLIGKHSSPAEIMVSTE
jgi:hypothetical protein